MTNQNALLKLYQRMKELDLIAHPKPELEAMLQDRSLERKEAYEKWKDSLPPKDKERFNKTFE